MSDQVPDFSKKPMRVEASMYDWGILVRHVGRQDMTYTPEGERLFNLVQKIEQQLGEGT